MATFHIHQDPHEKENVVNAGKQQHQQHPKNQEKRSTLTVLSNVGQHHVLRGQQGKVAVSTCLLFLSF